MNTEKKIWMLTHVEQILDWLAEQCDVKDIDEHSLEYFSGMAEKLRCHGRIPELTVEYKLEQSGAKMEKVGDDYVITRDVYGKTFTATGPAPRYAWMNLMQQIIVHEISKDIDPGDRVDLVLGMTESGGA